VIVSVLQEWVSVQHRPCTIILRREDAACDDVETVAFLDSWYAVLRIVYSWMTQHSTVSFEFPINGSPPRELP